MFSAGDCKTRVVPDADEDCRSHDRTANQIEQLRSLGGPDTPTTDNPA
jgi:hypothetical protein